MKTRNTYRRKKSSTPPQKTRSALRNVLNNMQASPYVGSFDDGEKYICPTCNLPIKLCMGNPSAICKLKVTENTQLSLLARAAGTQKTHGTCLLCGKRLSSRQLKHNPLRELCGACEARVVQVKVY